MTRLPLVALALFAGAAAADDAAARKFLKELEGNYTPVSITKGGDPVPDAEFKAVVLIAVKGDTLTVRFKKGDKDEDKAATLVADPGQTPIALDMTPKDGPDASKPVLGIVKVERDTVTICWGDRSDKAERPKDFSSTKDNKNFLIVMKKAR
jgi:uncharacterized protein (TIGR03067 family)